MQSWIMDRVKDPEMFLEKLSDPLPGEKAKPPTPEEREREGESFIKFAAAFGVQPPKPKPAAV